MVAWRVFILRLMSGRRQVRMSGRSTVPWLVSTCVRVHEGGVEGLVFDDSLLSNGHSLRSVKVGARPST